MISEMLKKQQIKNSHAHTDTHRERQGERERDSHKHTRSHLTYTSTFWSTRNNNNTTKHRNWSQYFAKTIHCETLHHMRVLSASIIVICNNHSHKTNPCVCLFGGFFRTVRTKQWTNKIFSSKQTNTTTERKTIFEPPRCAQWNENKNI